MRKQEKTQLLDLIETIKEAHQELNVLLLNNRLNEAAGLVADCQEAVIELGNTIEKAEGEEHKCIGLVQRYCEAAYELYDCITADRADLNEKKDCLEVSIKELAQGTERIECRFRMFFLPYKASMWTAMKSIWECAKDDPECEAVVMPIPYYDLDSKEQKIKLNYEGEFYTGIDIVNYKDVDLSKVRPEVIIIHNPYDGNNNLTRVPQEYYASELKKVTSCLVYSPYALESRTAGKGWYKYTMPGFAYADYVIAQNKKMKDLLCEIGYPQEKILDYGSPKIDEVYREYNNLSCERKPEYVGKKVFLYNTHFGIFTTNNEELFEYRIDRMIERIELFEKLENVILIWRPHPLLSEWIKKTMPERYGRILEIEKKIESCKNVIIDRSANYLETFKDSDALISTYSSLVPEYMITQKPIYIIENRRLQSLMEEDVVDYSKLYFRTNENAEILMEINEFVDMVVDSKDPLCEERKQNIEQDLLVNPGTAGQKIYEKLKGDN